MVSRTLIIEARIVLIFNEGRRRGWHNGGVFWPIALEINDPRRDVLLAPAHRPRCISWRSDEVRVAPMKPKLKLGACHLRIPTSVSVQEAGSSRPPRPGRRHHGQAR